MARELLHYLRAHLARLHLTAERHRRLKSANTRSWRKALKRAGITNFRWHDLRHTWASWLVQRRVPLFVLQELGGWQSAVMVRRYAHLSPSVNARYAAEIDQEFARGSNSRGGSL